MKTLLVIVFLITGSIASATTYYISPSGNDSNTGTITAPFFSLNKAWSVIKPGDIIYARGGTYRFQVRQTLTGKNGTSSDTIKIYAYPGERPIFTKSSTYSTPSWPNGLIYLDGDYTHWKGIEISNYKQATKAIWYGMAVLGSNHNKFERINSHHNGHGMVIRDESSNNLVLNCDFHHNYDPLTEGDAYGNADGLEVGYQSSSVVNTIKGCRLWNNSDDGIDLWNNNGSVIIDGCWSWKNGYREDGITTGGDGGGFKFGSTTVSSTDFKRTVKNSVSVYNRRIGYNQNSANVKFYMYNNIAYKNQDGFNFYAFNLANVMRNNVSFGNSSSNWTGTYSNSTMDHNSYDATVSPTGPAATSADFISIDTTGLSGSRNSNGSLPSLNFLKLASGSDLIDAGINVGIQYAGKAPDLGAFETLLAGTVTTDPTINLAYVSSKIENSTPNIIGVTYNHTLASTLPSVSSYTVKVNSVSRTISKLQITEQKVLITLGSPVASGDIVTVAYTRPATNPLQCTSLTFAETITAKPVTNEVATSASGTNSTASGETLIGFSPNPVREFMNVSNLAAIDGQTLKIFDTAGNLCLEQALQSGIVNRVPINLKKGIYIAKVFLGSVVEYAQKIVVI